MATLEKDIVDRIMGEIDDTLKNQVKTIISSLTE